MGRMAEDFAASDDPNGIQRVWQIIPSKPFDLGQ